MFACGDDPDSPDPGDDPDDPIENPLVDFECGSLFSTGDYSGLCFTSSATPMNMLVADQQGTISLCGYSILETPDDQVAVLSISTAPNVQGAAATYAATKNAADTPINAPGIGDDAYFTQEDETNRTLVILYKNAVISLTTEDLYCTFTEEEMKKFATELIRNI